MLVSVEDVGFGYSPSLMLFHGVSFMLAPGSTYALTGPSGSGKSTMLSLLNRFVKPSEGKIRFEGVERVNWVFQNPYGLSRRTVLDHVCTPLLDAGEGLASAAFAGHELLERFGLGSVAAQQFRTLSGGQAQRLMLARAVASDPDLLLIDEPTAQLDRRTSADVNAVMGELAGEGRIVVIATHDEDTRASCNRAFSMADWVPAAPDSIGST